MGWSYRQADPHLGKQNAEFLASELEAALAEYPVMLQVSSNSVHIVPKGIDKGVAVNKVICLKYSFQEGRSLSIGSIIHKYKFIFMYK